MDEAQVSRLEYIRKNDVELYRKVLKKDISIDMAYQNLKK